MDQFGGALLNGVPYHEEFGTFTPSAKYPNENWGLPNAKADNTVANTIPPGSLVPPGTYNGTFNDDYWRYNTWPNTISPSIDPYGQDLVLSGSQSYYVGSQSQGQGCLVNSGTLRYYLDHANHE